MDLFEMIEDEFDEYFNNISYSRRSRVVRVRPDYYELLDDVDFRSRFILSKPSVSYVLPCIT